MNQETQFEGWLAYDAAAAAGHMTWGPFEPKPWEETDIDIRISHCGVCSSDIHTLRSDWGPTHYPAVVGHEIIGIAVRVGTNVKTGIQVGDRVGVGAQSDACLCRKPPAIEHDWSNCAECAGGKENCCPRASTTYNSFFHSAAAGGAKTMGGYGHYQRCPSHFVFKIPDELRSEHAAPLMCAGVTVYSALAGIPRSVGIEEHLKRMRVGVVGIGGLGHLAILFAKAMGADYIVAISRQADKRKDVLELGANDYIAAGRAEDWSKIQNNLDLVISTVSTAGPIAEHLGLLKPGGRYIMLGMPSGALKIDATLLVVKRITITGSLIGSPEDVRDTLRFAAQQGIEPWVEMKDMMSANEAIMDMEAGKARYRIVLCNKI